MERYTIDGFKNPREFISHNIVYLLIILMLVDMYYLNNLIMVLEDLSKKSWDETYFC